MNSDFEAFTSESDYVSSVTLVFIGQDLDPELITDAIGILPSQSWKRGETKIFRSGRKHVYSWGGWKLFQSDATLHVPLHKQFEYWVSLLAEKADRLRKLREMNYPAVLDCYISIDEVATETFTAELLAKIASIGVGIELNCFASNAQGNAASGKSGGKGLGPST